MTYLLTFEPYHENSEPWTIVRSLRKAQRMAEERVSMPDRATDDDVAIWKWYQGRFVLVGTWIDWGDGHVEYAPEQVFA